MNLPTRTEGALRSRLKNGLYRSALELMSSEFVCKDQNSPFNWIGEFIKSKAPPDIILDLMDSYPELAHQIDGENKCSLFHAASEHRIDVVIKLIELNVDINKDLNGFGNCVNVAARFEGKDFIRELISMGANPNALSTNGVDAKKVAFRWGNFGNIDFFEAIEKNPKLVEQFRSEKPFPEKEFNI